MANLPEVSAFDPVYQWETTDLNLAGFSGVMNTPLKALTNRTKYLRDQGTWKLRTEASTVSLKALSSSERIDGGQVFVSGKGFYRYVAASVASADDNRVLLPGDSSGRWLLDVPDLGWLATNELTLGGTLYLRPTGVNELFWEARVADEATTFARLVNGNTGGGVFVPTLQAVQADAANYGWDIRGEFGASTGAGASTDANIRFFASSSGGAWGPGGRRAFSFAVQRAGDASPTQILGANSDGTWTFSDIAGAANALQAVFQSPGRSGTLTVLNGSSAPGLYAPTLSGLTYNAAVGGLALRGVSAGVDINSAPLVWVDGRRSDNTALTSRDLFGVYNNGVQRYRVTFAGTGIAQPASDLLARWGISDVALGDGHVSLTNNAGAPGSAVFEPALTLQATASRTNILQAFVADDASTTQHGMLIRAFGPASAALTTRNVLAIANASNLLWTLTSGGALVSQTVANAPTFTTRSTGTKLVLLPNISGTTQDYAVGVEAGYTWFSTAQAISSNGFKWYAATTQVAALTGAGRFIINSQAQAGIAEDFLTIALSGHGNSSFAINNHTEADSRVGWRVQGIAGENSGDPGLTLKGLGLDAGGEGVLVLQASTTADGTLGTRPVLRVKNNANILQVIAASGSQTWSHTATTGAAQNFFQAAANVDAAGSLNLVFQVADAGGTNRNQAAIVVTKMTNTAAASVGRLALQVNNLNGTLQPVLTLNGDLGSSLNGAVLLNGSLGGLGLQIGGVSSTSGLGANSPSTGIRFNGAAVAWGDIGYFPNGGGDGHFRFSTTGSAFNGGSMASIAALRGDFGASNNMLAASFFRDVNAAASSNTVEVTIGNKGASQGKLSIQYANAPTTGSPQATLGFFPRNNAGTASVNPVSLTMQKTAGADTGRILLTSAGSSVEVDPQAALKYPKGFGVGIQRITVAGPHTLSTASESHLSLVPASNAAATVNIFTPVGNAGRVVVVADGKGIAGSFPITIVPAAGTINGAASFVLNADWESVTLVSDGVNWLVC